jgi:hypothetical protein
MNAKAKRFYFIVHRSHFIVLPVALRRARVTNSARHPQVNTRTGSNAARAL